MMARSIFYQSKKAFDESQVPRRREPPLCTCRRLYPSPNQVRMRHIPTIVVIIVVLSSDATCPKRLEVLAKGFISRTRVALAGGANTFLLR